MGSLKNLTFMGHWWIGNNQELKRHLLFLFIDISEFFLFFCQTDRIFKIVQLYET